MRQCLTNFCSSVPAAGSRGGSTTQERYGHAAFLSQDDRELAALIYLGGSHAVTFTQPVLMFFCERLTVNKQGEGTCCVDVPASRSAWQKKGGCLLLLLMSEWLAPVCDPQVVLICS